VSIFEGVILAAIQGLTEFLPVSSSGHLAIALALMGKTETGEMTFWIALLHLASAGAVIVYFWKDLLRLATDRRRELAWILIGSIPAVVVGFTLKGPIEQSVGMIWLIGILLVVTGLILFFADRVRAERVGMPEGGPARAVIIGIAQAFAILPGFSRSGLTISAGLFCGIRREDAFRFSFLLGLPAILGAGTLKIIDGAREGIEVAAGPLVLSLVLTFILSLGAIKLLSVLLLRRRLIYFAAYCVLVGAATVIVATMG
jgi:undecaprenyl-diphosphatase